MIDDILGSMTADNLRDVELKQHWQTAKELMRVQKENQNLKMVCRRLAAAKTLATRDRIAKQCAKLFAGSPLRDTVGVSKK